MSMAAPPVRWPPRALRAIVSYANDGGRFDTIPPRAARDGVAIGAAVRLYQHARRRGTIGSQTANALAALPGWQWEAPTDHRRKGVAAATISAIRAHVARGGVCSAIPGDLEIDGVNLRYAVGYVRCRYHRRELRDDAISALEALPGWAWGRQGVSVSASPDYGRAGGRRPHPEVLSLLLRFVARHGHCWVPRYHVEEGFRLGSWVHVQRLHYRKGRLREPRIRELEQLPGWTWNPTAEREEAARQLSTPGGTLLALLDYVSTAVPGGPSSAADVHDETMWSGVPLRPALDEVRRLHALRLLPRLLVRRFEAVPGWDWTPTDRVGRYLTALRSFVAREGHSLVPRRHTEGEIELGRWVSKARERYHAGRISSAEIAVLEALPGWLWRVRLPTARGSTANPSVVRQAA